MTFCIYQKYMRTGMAFSSKKYFRNFGGHDLRSPELLRDGTTATDTLNVSLSENLSLTKRRGHQTLGRGRGGAGSVTFNQIDIASGIQTQSRLVFDEGAHKHEQDSISISYSGTSNPSIEIKVEDSQFKMFLYEDGILSQTLGLGTGEGISEVSIDTALASLALPFSFTGTTNSANVISSHLKVTPFTSFTGSIDVPFRYYVELDYPTGVSSPLQAHYDTRNDSNFEINSTVQVNDVLYVTNGKTGLYKYDTARFYRAGLPKPTDLSTALVGSSGLDNDDYIYRIVYKHTDATDNIVFSTPSNESLVTITGTESVNITIPNIEHGSGFDTDGSIEILLLRTNPGGTVLFVLDTITNDPLNATQVYSDSNSAVLTEDYTLPPFELNLVPSKSAVPAAGEFACRYIDVWRGQLILTGNEEDVNEVYPTDVEYIEGFSESNSFTTSTRLGGPNTGVKSLDNYLFIFKANSITAVTGDLATRQFQVDTLTDEGIGCLAHASLVESKGRIWFLGRRGVYSVSRDGVTLESAPLTPIFTEELNKIDTLRSVGFNWIHEEQILFLLPETSIATGEVYTLNSSRVLAYNSQVGVWTVWDNIDFSSGMNLDGEDVWFSGKYVNDSSVAIDISSEVLRTYTELDYADKTGAVEFVYKDNWDTLGEPSIPKKFVRLKLYSLDTPLQGFETSNFSIDIETNHDYIDEVVSKTTLEFKEPDTGWGSFKWGVARWGEVKPVSRRTRLLPKKCRSLRTVLSNSVLYQNVLLSGYEFEVAFEHQFYMRNK